MHIVQWQPFLWTVGRWSKDKRSDMLQCRFDTKWQKVDHEFLHCKHHWTLVSLQTRVTLRTMPCTNIGWKSGQRTVVQRGKAAIPVRGGELSSNITLMYLSVRHSHHTQDGFLCLSLHALFWLGCPWQNPKTKHWHLPLQRIDPWQRQCLSFKTAIFISGRSFAWHSSCVSMLMWNRQIFNFASMCRFDAVRMKHERMHGSGHQTCEKWNAKEQRVNWKLEHNAWRGLHPLWTWLDLHLQVHVGHSQCLPSQARTQQNEIKFDFFLSADSG